MELDLTLDRFCALSGLTRKGESRQHAVNVRRTASTEQYYEINLSERTDASLHERILSEAHGKLTSTASSGARRRESAWRPRADTAEALTACTAAPRLTRSQQDRIFP